MGVQNQEVELRFSKHAALVEGSYLAMVPDGDGGTIEVEFTKGEPWEDSIPVWTGSPEELENERLILPAPE